MRTFKLYLSEGPTTWGNNEKGVFHELLTGYHLNGRKHIKDPKGRPGETAKQAHDRLHKQAMAHGGKKLVDACHAKAKAAAEDIRKQVGNVKHVHWTSKAGDVERVTGVKVANQKDDASDIIVSDHTGKHHGISLKVSDKTAKVPASSLGQKSSGRKTVTLSTGHKEKIIGKHPELKGKNKDARKKWASENPEKHAEIKKMNQKALGDVAKKHARELNARIRLGGKHVDHVINHLRDVMGAKKAPMQQAGHNYIKHTTYQNKSGIHHHTSNPGGDHEHIFNQIKANPKSLKVSHTAGGTVNFHLNGKRFASQSHKFDSQSDPLSTMKTAGRIA